MIPSYEMKRWSLYSVLRSLPDSSKYRTRLYTEQGEVSCCKHEHDQHPFRAVSIRPYQSHNTLLKLHSNNKNITKLKENGSLTKANSDSSMICSSLLLNYSSISRLGVLMYIIILHHFAMCKCLTINHMLDQNYAGLSCVPSNPAATQSPFD